MTKEFQLRVDPRTAADNERVAAFVARQGNFDRGRIKIVADFETLNRCPSASGHGQFDG